MSMLVSTTPPTTGRKVFVLSASRYLNQSKVEAGVRVFMQITTIKRAFSEACFVLLAILRLGICTMTLT